ncbi:RlpA-like double-psi beta-barrel-protein domain-containing protein-containing protein [Trametes elegans]|nr:RlpA-like double-psi beta-barrel-protein domain-containing protein-containing protein [Trametes elegans]
MMLIKALPAVVVALLMGSVNAFSGDATYYNPGGNFGACGTRNQDSELVAALNPTQYSGGSNCGRHINVHYQGKTVNAKVVDLCPGCGSGSVDLSPAAFQKLAPLSVGRIKVTWEFS